GAAYGVAGAGFPGDAESAVATGPQSVTVAKQAAPERLAPPQAQTSSPPIQVLTTKPTSVPVSPPSKEAYAPPAQAYAPPSQAYAPPQPQPAASPARSVEQQGSFTTAERLMDW